MASVVSTVSVNGSDVTVLACATSSFAGFVPVVGSSASWACQDPNGVGPRLFFQRVPESKTVKNRVHLDVRVAPGLEGAERMAALEAECDRLVALGATRVRRHEPAGAAPL